MKTSPSLFIPADFKRTDRQKSPEEIGTEFAALFFEQILKTLLSEGDQTVEGEYGLDKYFQTVVLAQSFAQTEMARPIREAVSQDILKLQEIPGGQHA